MRTEFQHLVIGRTEQGVALFSDGERQSTEFSQLVYHEALLVPALLLADKIDRVLVIGSGEGVVSQLAVAAGATQVDHVDIDREAVRLCAKHLPYGYTTDELLTAERGLGPITVHYRDGWSFVADSSTSYDVVVVDLPDERTEPVQHNRLYDVDFLRTCRNIGRVVVFPGWVPDTVAQRVAAATRGDDFKKPSTPWCISAATSTSGRSCRDWPKAWPTPSRRCRPAWRRCPTDHRPSTPTR